MNSHFHTPSLGDESFDLSGIDETVTAPMDFVSAGTADVDSFESKRMRSMEQHIPVSDELNAYNIGSNTATIAATINSNSNHSGNSGIFNITAHLNNNQANSNNSTPPALSLPPTTTLAARKQMAPSSTDPNEPPKPLSAYTLFFRDTVSAIKQQNPNCHFQELSRIVTSMWKELDIAQKDVYNKKTEASRNEYVKQLRIYRQQQQQQQQQQLRTETNPGEMDDSNEYNANILSQSNEFQPEQQLQTSTSSMMSTLSAPDVQSSEEAQITAITSSTSSSSITTAAPTTNPLAAIQTQEAVTQQQQNQISVENHDGPVLCIRDGCNKQAIMNPDWEDEYCSNECVVIHCRNVFNNWVQQNRETTTPPTATAVQH